MMKRESSTSKKNEKFRNKSKGKSHKYMRDKKGEYTTDADTRDANGNNDPSWYSTNPALLRDAASIPFSWSNGTPIDLNMPTSFPDGYIVPGICSISLRPSIGYADNPTDPINVAATAAYSFVRHANSGHANYDSPDLMLYLVAMSNVYAYINYLQRAYASATLFSQRNRYLPNGLLKSMRIDPNDVQKHLADFRYGINVLVHKAAAMAVPAEMTYFMRTSFLYQNVYTEGTSIKDQLYLYNPAAFYKFAIEPTTSAGMLEMLDIAVSTSTLWTVDQLLDMGNQLLNPIIGNEDMNIMSGDILKAYGSDKLIKLMECPEYLPLIPIFNIGVLEQMKNAEVQGIQGSSNKVTQSTNKAYLIHKPRAVKVNEELRKSRKLLTTTTDEVTPELVMESSRLKLGFGAAVSNEEAYVYTGSEIVNSMEIIKFNKDGTLQGSFYNGPIKLGALTDVPSVLGTVRDLSNFRFHPAAVFDYNSVHYPMFDLDNYAVLTSDNVRRLHEAALLSMLNVPAIARASV